MEGIKIHGYEIIKLLGNGSFGSVYSCRSIKTGKNYAIKAFDKSEEESEISFKNEVSKLKLLKNNSIVKYIESFEENDNFFIVLEEIQGYDLFDVITKSDKLNEKLAKKYTYEIAKVIKYLTDNDIIHHDIKCENIMIDALDNVKIVDFGSCVEIQETSKFLFNGSLPYMAPEMAQNKAYNEEIDVWSLGICLYVMVVGELPFFEKNRIRLLQKIILTEPKYPDYLSDDCVSLLKLMLEKDPKRRITIKGVLKHQWFKSFLMEKKQQKCISSFHSYPEYYNNNICM